MLGNKSTSNLLGNIDYLMHSNDGLLNPILKNIIGGMLIPSEKMITLSKSIKSDKDANRDFDYYNKRVVGYEKLKRAYDRGLIKLDNELKDFDDKGSENYDDLSLLEKDRNEVLDTIKKIDSKIAHNIIEKNKIIKERESVKEIKQIVSHTEFKDEVLKLYKIKYSNSLEGYGKAFEDVLCTTHIGKKTINSFTGVLPNAIIKNWSDNIDAGDTQFFRDFFPLGDIYNSKANMEIKYYDTKGCKVNIEKGYVYNEYKKDMNIKGVPIQLTKFLGTPSYKPYFKYDKQSNKVKLIKIQSSYKNKNIIPTLSGLDYYIIMKTEDGLYYFDICNNPITFFLEPDKGTDYFTIDPIETLFLKNKGKEHFKGNFIDVCYVPFNAWKKIDIKK